MTKKTFEIEQFTKTSPSADLDIGSKEVEAWYDKDSGTIDIEFPDKDIGVTGFGIKLKDLLTIVADNV